MLKLSSGHNFESEKTSLTTKKATDQRGEKEREYYIVVFFLLMGFNIKHTLRKNQPWMSPPLLKSKSKAPHKPKMFILSC